MSRTKRLILSAAAALSVVVLLAAVGYAFGYILYEVKDNYFHTGTVDVEITTDVPQEGNVNLFTPGVLYEPGMTVRGNFQVKNLSTDENGIWYRLYFTQLGGELAQVMEAKFYDGETLLWSGPVRSLTNRLSMAEPLPMAHGAQRTLTLELHYPEAEGNDTQGKEMTFALAVVAVQGKNNPDAQFE